MANPAENNKIEQTEFKKIKIVCHQWAINWSNVEEKNALSDILRTYIADYFDINVPFVKRTDALINGFKYYDTTTQKEETIEFYNYYNHLMGNTHP